MRATKLPETQLTAIDPDPDTQLASRMAQRRDELLMPDAPSLLNFTGRQHGPPDVIGLSDREIEHGHDGVANGLVEQPVKFPNGAGAFVTEYVQ